MQFFEYRQAGGNLILSAALRRLRSGSETASRYPSPLLLTREPMQQTSANWITLAIALWGALTGTIAVIFESRRFRKERPDLVIEPSWVFTWSDLPPEVALHIKVANRGHRHTTVDGVFAQLGQPFDWNLPRWLKRRRSVFPFQPHPRDHRIDESDSENLRFRNDALPVGIELYDVRRVVVADVTGRRWRSTSGFDQQHIRALLTGEVQAAEFGDTKAVRRAVAKCIKWTGGGVVWMQEKRGSSTSTTHRTCSSTAEAVRMFERAAAVAEKYVAGTADQYLGVIE